MRHKLLHTKRVRAKGRDYLYFDTGKMSARGTKIYSRLPAVSDPSFGATYAALLAARSRRANAATQMLVPALCDMYEKSPHFAKLAPSSRTIYSLYLKRFREMMPTAPAAQIEQADMTRLLDRMADKPGAANMLLAVVGSLYAWARKRQHVSNDPTRDIEKFELGEHDPWPTDLLVKGLTSADPFIRRAVHLLYFTAQRIGDACAMRWGDIEGDILRVRQEKTDHFLEIRIHAELARELTLGKEGPTILTGKGGRPLKPVAARRRLQAWATEQGHKVVPHGLRKNAVIALLEAGCSAAETAAISGQSLQMVEHYAKMRAQKTLGGTAILKWERARNAK